MKSEIMIVLEKLKKEYDGIIFPSGTIETLFFDELEKMKNDRITEEKILAAVQERIRSEVTFDKKIILDSFVEKHFNKEMSCNDVKKSFVEFSLFLERIGLVTYKKTKEEYAEYLFFEYPILCDLMEKVISEEEQRPSNKTRIYTFYEAYDNFCYSDYNPESKKAVLPKFLEIYIQDIEQLELSDENIESLIQKYQNGDMTVRDKIIEKNLKLVLFVVKECFLLDDSNLELVQEGNLALMKAIECYDPSIGVKFSTYAYKVILKTLIKYSKENKLAIRINFSAMSKMTMINRVIEDYTSNYGVFPSYDKISEIVGISRETVFALMTLREGIEDIESVDAQMVRAEKNFDDEFWLTEIKTKLFELLKNNLTEDELKIVLMKIGFFSEEPMALREIVEIVGGCEQGISNKIKKAFIKITNIKGIEEFGDIIGEYDKFKERIKKIRKLAPKEKLYESFSTCVRAKQKK